MKAGWQTTLFEDCIEPVTYTTKIQRKDFLSEGAFPIVSQEEELINGRWENDADLFKVERPLVLFGDHTRTFKYVDFDFVLGADGVKILKPKAFLHPRYFYFQLQTAKLKSLGYARHYRLLKEHSVSYPDLAEQRRIVTLLDEAFADIATAKANAEKNLQNARDLLNQAIQDDFKNAVEKYGTITLGKVCTFENGDRGQNYPGKQHRVEKGIPFINAGHLTPDGLDFNEMDYISPERFALLGNGKIKPNDVLFCLRGSLGKFSCVGNLAQGAIASSLVILRPTQDLDLNYLLMYLSSRQCNEQIESLKGGTAQPNLGAKDLKQFGIPLPATTIQIEMANRLSDLKEQIESITKIYTRKLTDLEDLKKSLLHQAFSGRL